MKNLLVVENWKSNMTKTEAKTWLEEFFLNEIPDYLEIVLLPPFTLLDNISAYIKTNDLNLKLGAQNISQFGTGAYTGEINEKQIKEFADYVLVGHSERRANFSETEDIVNKKIQIALGISLKPIVCVSNLDQVKKISANDIVIAYEPIEAIGTGNAEDPASVSSFASEIKKIKNVKVLYGGSVTAQNLKNYTNLPELEGVLIGGAGLSASSFANLLENAI